jgi:hypothetical protein
MQRLWNLEEAMEILGRNTLWLSDSDQKWSSKVSSSKVSSSKVSSSKVSSSKVSSSKGDYYLFGIYKEKPSICSPKPL